MGARTCCGLANGADDLPILGKGTFFHHCVVLSLGFPNIINDIIQEINLSSALFRNLRPYSNPISFSSNVTFQIQGPNPWPHILLSHCTSLISFYFDPSDTLFCIIPQCGLVWNFLMIRLRLRNSGKSTAESHFVLLSVPPVKGTDVNTQYVNTVMSTLISNDWSFSFLTWSHCASSKPHPLME